MTLCGRLLAHADASKTPVLSSVVPRVTRSGRRAYSRSDAAPCLPLAIRRRQRVRAERFLPKLVEQIGPEDHVDLPRFVRECHDQHHDT